MKTFCDRRAPGCYRSPREIYGRYWLITKGRRGWVVSDTQRDPWPDVVFPTLRDADRAIASLPEPVRNLMSGKEVWERAGTPYSCSVASESYWSN